MVHAYITYFDIHSILYFVTLVAEYGNNIMDGGKLSNIYKYILLVMDLVSEIRFLQPEINAINMLNKSWTRLFFIFFWQKVKKSLVQLLRSTQYSRLLSKSKNQLLKTRPRPITCTSYLLL